MSLSERIRPGVEAAPWVIDEIKALEEERDALRARVEAMEKQEPVAWVRKLGLDLPSVGCVTDLKYRPSDIPESSYIPLYLAPSAQPAPSIPEGWKLVPIESTSVMDVAGSDHCDGYRSIAEAVWSAMIEASPEAKP